MTIATRAEMVAALASNPNRIGRSNFSYSNTVAGQLWSFWTKEGSTPTSAAVPTSATAGAIGFVNAIAPRANYLVELGIVSSFNYNGLELHDRLAHLGGLSGTVTSSQGILSLITTDPGADRLGPSNYSEVQWWLEIYTQLGATSANATVAVTYNDATTGNLAPIILGGTPREGRIYPCISAVSGKYIRAVNGVTLSATTGTAGNFGITATRQHAVLAGMTINESRTFDYSQLGFQKIPNNACLFPIVLVGGGSTGQLRMNGRLANG